jgi:beta-lactamase superfamily II metal-dependent hydrolase
LVLIANLCSLLLAGWFPWAAEVFNHAGWFLMRAIEHTSQWSANWPAAYYYVPIPSLFTIIVYYALLLAIFTGWLFRKEQRKWRVAGVALLAFSWCVVYVVQNPSATRVTILPMNGGHAVFAKTSAGRKTWLIDTGNKSSVEMLVKPYLQAQGVNRLDHLLLSHGEAAYTGGAELVSEHFSPRLVYTSRIRFRSPDYVNYLKILESTRTRHEHISCGDQIGDWTVLYPPDTATFTRANDNAMVLRGDFGSARLLLLSDLGGLGQNALLERTNDLRADIVVAGLPNEGEPLNELLIDAVHPKVIVIADADFPANKRAGRKLQQRLAAKRIPIIYTRNSEAVTLEISAKNWELSAMDGTRISGQRPAEH